jgi:hypothetical protein
VCRESEAGILGKGSRQGRHFKEAGRKERQGKTGTRQACKQVEQCREVGGAGEGRQLSPCKVGRHDMSGMARESGTVNLDSMEG